MQDTINIGQKLKVARLQQRLSLRELAERAEVSASLLSKIENGKATPSVRSLHSIAEALLLPVDYFFPKDDQKRQNPAPAEPAELAPEQPAPSPVVGMTPSQFRVAQSEAMLTEGAPGFSDESQHIKELVVRANARQRIDLLGGIVWERLTPSTEESAEFLQICYDVGAKSGEKMSHHSGREFQFVLEGELLLELGFERYLLKAGDSIIFDSETPHRLSNAGQVPLRAISVIFNTK
jgi:mannose-6-phosphate isomerase-like protein (cupin superfamily)/DNA-binding XRE family transcriptional regulator